jgi:hypothetical protein
MKSTQILIFLSLGGLGYSAPVNQSCTPNPQPLCGNLLLPIEATAMNTAFPPYPNDTSAGVFYKYLASISNLTLETNYVSGKYNISVSYCKPTVKVEGRQDSIQMLLHGVSATKVRFPFSK